MLQSRQGGKQWTLLMLLKRVVAIRRQHHGGARGTEGLVAEVVVRSHGMLFAAIMHSSLISHYRTLIGEAGHCQLDVCGITVSTGKHY